MEEQHLPEVASLRVWVSTSEHLPLSTPPWQMLTTLTICFLSTWFCRQDADKQQQPLLMNTAASPDKLSPLMLCPALVSPEEEMPQSLWKHIPPVFLFQKSEIRQFILYDVFLNPKVEIKRFLPPNVAVCLKGALHPFPCKCLMPLKTWVHMRCPLPSEGLLHLLVYYATQRGVYIDVLSLALFQTLILHLDQSTKWWPTWSRQWNTSHQLIVIFIGRI